MVDTPNLQLPVMGASQAQKHVTFNEAILRLDGMVQLSVKDRDLAAPPGSPATGDRYIVASGATGAWATKDLNVAVLIDGAWRFLVPRLGWLAWVEDENKLLLWTGLAWGDFLGSLASAYSGALLKLGINTAADNTNRLALKSDAVLLSHDDVTPGTGDMRVTLNKSAAAKDAAFSLQDGFSIRALFGLLADNDFTLKVSADER